MVLQLPGSPMCSITGITILAAQTVEISVNTLGESAYIALANSAAKGNKKAAETMAFALVFGDNFPQNITAAKILLDFFAEQGSSKAQRALGLLSSFGIGVDHNQAKAVVYYTFGGLGGDLVSQLILGYKYWSGINVHKNCEAALLHYRNVAVKIIDKLDSDEGFPVEKVRLTMNLENPNTNDENEIMDWDIYQYSKFQAARGNINAQVALGVFHYTGRRGLKQDHFKAHYYFLKAADAGNANALALLGMMYLKGSPAAPQNYHTALRYFTLSAYRGNPRGLYGLGLLYLQGKGVTVNYGEAFRYFNKSAVKGWTSAKFQLGIMYYNGLGITKDYKNAYRYLHIASRGRHPLASFNLAQMYAKGTGVLRSCQKAVQLYKNVCELGIWSEMFLPAYYAYRRGDIDSSLIQYLLLAEIGYESAQSNAAYILESQRVNIFSKDHIYPLALLLWKRAAAQGNALARIKIGDYYFYGHGTERDLIAATTQYSLAANEHQSAQALFNLGYMIEHGLGIDKDIPLARKLYALAARASPEATIAFFVFFAILKLDILQFFRSLQLFNITDAMETLNITKTLLPYWDVVLITLIAALLLILLGNRLFRNYVWHLVLLFCTSNF
ncbi:protein sel-1 homolog 2 [Ascaphus truei]|uniref:protein sel-1 homolog 2 n=1 Tax=Ascaphus truei TaxID=8439 RepID=UPI003F5A2A1A